MDVLVVVVWVVWKRLSFFGGGSATRPKIMSTALTRGGAKRHSVYNHSMLLYSNP